MKSKDVVCMFGHACKLNTEPLVRQYILWYLELPPVAYPNG